MTPVKSQISKFQAEKSRQVGFSLLVTAADNVIELWHVCVCCLLLVLNADLLSESR